jgi:hypothetical protein
MCSYADDREQRSILITFSAVSIGTTKISLPFEMFTRLLQPLSGKSAIGDPLRSFSRGDHTSDTKSTPISDKQRHRVRMSGTNEPAKGSRGIRHAGSSGNVFAHVEVSSSEDTQAKRASDVSDTSAIRGVGYVC